MSHLSNPGNEFCLLSCQADSQCNNPPPSSRCEQKRHAAFLLHMPKGILWSSCQFLPPLARKDRSDQAQPYVNIEELPLAQSLLDHKGRKMSPFSQEIQGTQLGTFQTLQKVQPKEAPLSQVKYPSLKQMEIDIRKGEI